MFYRVVTKLAVTESFLKFVSKVQLMHEYRKGQCMDVFVFVRTKLTEWLSLLSVCYSYIYIASLLAI